MNKHYDEAKSFLIKSTIIYIIGLFLLYTIWGKDIFYQALFLTLLGYIAIVFESVSDMRDWSPNRKRAPIATKPIVAEKPPVVIRADLLPKWQPTNPARTVAPAFVNTKENTPDYKPAKINGNWDRGWSLDEHTISSIMIDPYHFDTKRTELGELLYQVKYKNISSKIDRIANAITDFIRKEKIYVHVIVPVPPSQRRSHQPVDEICRAVSRKTGIPCDVDYLRKVKITKQLKSEKDIEKRKESLKDAFRINENKRTIYQNKNILIIDDLYRSGSTLNEITDTIREQKEGNNICVITATRTRVNK